jgi:nitrate/nitrite transport system permease protein
VIFITAIWPIIINTAVGIRNIPQDYRNVAAVLRLNHLEFFWKIMMPAAAPYIFTGPAHRHRPVLARDRRGRNADRRRRHRLLHLGRLELLAHQRHHRGAVYIGLVGFVLDRMIAALATVVTRGTAAN